MEHYKDVDWASRFRDDMTNIHTQKELEITEKKVKKGLTKIANWKAPVPDMLQGYWLKNVRSLYKKLTDNLSECLERGNVPTWMTKGRTVLIQKVKKDELNQVTIDP